MDFKGTTGVMGFRQRMTMFGRPTNIVSSICGLQTENDSDEFQKGNDSGGIQT